MKEFGGESLYIILDDWRKDDLFRNLVQIMKASLTSFDQLDPTKNDIIYSLNNENRYIGSKPFVEREELATKVLGDLYLPLSQIYKDY